MTAAVQAPAPAAAIPTRTGAAPARLRNGYCFELVKLLAQWRIRALLAVCWIGPALLVAVVSKQESLPADTVFGRWMGQTGWAGPLVGLGFSTAWLLALLTSVVAGDVFSTEDRLGTWRHLLVAVRSPRRIFAAKALASVSVILLLVVGLAASSIAGGLLAAGNRPLVGLTGQLMAPGDAAAAVLLAWAAALAPTLAFAAVGVLGSVAFGRSPMGLLMPALLAFALQVAQMLPLPVVVRVALPSYEFVAWHGLFTQPGQVGPLVLAIAVSLVWAVVATMLAYLMFVRRDFTDPTYEGAGRRTLVRAVLPLAALLAVTAGLLAVTTDASGSGIDRPKLERSLATSFAHLYRLQSRELHRPDVTEQQLGAAASCDKGGSLSEDVGAGNNWRCVLTWHIPGSGATGTAVYQLDVTPDGRYIADGDGPQAVNGYFQVRTPAGDQPNPLWQLDGSVNLLSPITAKG